MTPSCGRDIVEWCDVNCTTAYEISETHILFESGDDALLFKLMFSA